MTAVHYHTGRFPPKNIQWERLIPLIGPANASLARYDGMLEAIPNPKVLLSPLFTQEAVLSSRIEGTQTTMDEVLEYEAGAEPGRFGGEREADIKEVLNYRRAMNAAETLLEKLPLAQRVIRETHQVLMEDVRGKDRAPGEYRRLPNWIGAPGCRIEDARYIPIPADQLPTGMDRWERYIHETEADKLVQLANVHAEFEALHPFLDGNGRLGRMIIPLFLFHAGILRRAIFYMSAYLEARRDEYYDRLLAVSRDDDWTGWCVFFLTGLTAQAEGNLQKVRNILNLYETKKTKIAEATHSQYAIRALDFLFKYPVFQVPQFVNRAGIPNPTAKRIVRILRGIGTLGVLREASGRRPAVLVFRKLLNVTEGLEIF